LNTIFPFLPLSHKSGITRREESQRAFTYIEHACFRCHNIVRDTK